MTDTAASGGAPADAPERPGLRERKKAKTRAAIRACALRLFRTQGYDATTVEQIADAAEVSPSTFFRYFPTKEDVVLTDELDPLVIEAFRAQPAAVPALEALRRAMRSVFGTMSASERRDMEERLELMRTVAALRSAFLGQLAEMMEMIEDLVARRAGRRRTDPAVRTFAGAVLGVIMSVYLHLRARSADDMLAAMDEALGLLEAGLPL